ncbi:TPA: DUF4376 domain-containing protein [Vibrio parahaemolyticus]|uniref:DUF4376 domain-containing protein n=1 Tax=Vibrio parahaemolyticus TaxID=670 RepID=UPI000405093C|nr:DUF4376 domain-containing protein [Vibrio parahaemolyticus]HBC3410848.1 DUF4376 domain-containing protein [Vibrio parahaemolyticus]HCE1554725.1 DUF4376 domain-containing protein [Vibrio parahaemolyticus]HCE3530976.1 DUF4376 domain-containing protein [Vibrio parahaemolyticus]HCE4498463.1 DUF4376 domain-containing protein [Vibrio parahaemolyticus]HCE4525320.1 DUF4376 domain-containing protein [Vibrio parahaemolyticus]
MIIDTDYTALTDIDENIRHYYAEDIRERVIGYTEGEEPSPITEQYTVIVLNKPEEITFHDVNQRRGERKSWEQVVKPELERAIAWEDFQVNHDQYLQWLVDVENFVPEITIGEDGEEVATLPPERPVIDMQNRRAVYEVIEVPYDANYYTHNGEYDYLVNDEEFTVTKTPVVERKPDNVIAEFHRNKAQALRDEIKLSNIFIHGYEFQVRQVDRNNMDETLWYAERNNMLDKETVWIAANNEPVRLTYNQIQQIKDAYAIRLEKLFNQYATWTEGDMQTPFEFLEA